MGRMEGSRRSCQKKRVEIRQSYCICYITFYFPIGQVRLPSPQEKRIGYKNKIQITQKGFQMSHYSLFLLGPFIVNGGTSLSGSGLHPLLSASCFSPSSHTLLSPLLSEHIPFARQFLVQRGNVLCKRGERKKRNIYNPASFHSTSCLLKKETSFSGFAATTFVLLTGIREREIR